MRLRVKEAGASERRPVIGRIGVATSPPGNRADFPLVLAYGNPRSTALGSKADMSADRNGLAGAAPSSRAGFRSAGWLLAPSQYRTGGLLTEAAACGGSARSGWLSWQAVVHHREVDNPQAVKRVAQCLSRMRRKGARTVLRGGGSGDRASLPDFRDRKIQSVPWPPHRSAAATSLAGFGGPGHQ